MLNQWLPEPMFQMPADEILLTGTTHPPNPQMSTPMIPCPRPGGNQLSTTMTST